MRSDSWVKKELQDAAARADRKRRERAPQLTMLVPHDGSRHERVAGCLWDLIVAMDDATGEMLSMFLRGKRRQGEQLPRDPGDNRTLWAS